METHSSILAWRIPMDRGAWQATVHGVAKSWTRLRDLAQHSCFTMLCQFLLYSKVNQLYYTYIPCFWIAFPFSSPQSTEQFPVLYIRVSLAIYFIQESVACICNSQCRIPVVLSHSLCGNLFQLWWWLMVQLLSHVQLLRPHRLQPTRLLCPQDSPSKNTGVGCHLFQQPQETNTGPI